MRDVALYKFPISICLSIYLSLPVQQCHLLSVGRTVVLVPVPCATGLAPSATCTNTSAHSMAPSLHWKVRLQLLLFVKSRQSVSV